MPQQDDTGATTVLPARRFSLDPSPDPASRDLEIFSKPGVEAVFLWWLESKRRWTERDGTSALTPGNGELPRR